MAALFCVFFFGMANEHCVSLSLEDGDGYDFVAVGMLGRGGTRPRNCVDGWGPGSATGTVQFLTTVPRDPL